MNLINAIIIDDEDHNRSVLKTLLERYCPQIQANDEAGSVDEAYDKILMQKPKLVFLDIKMPEKSGFDLLKMFSSIDFEVIFVSAFNEYAITAFEFNALGYILKPIDYSKLIAAVNKAVLKIQANTQNDNVFHFVKTLEEKSDLISKITVHHHGKVIFINIDDITSIETIGDNACELTISDDTRFSSSKNLKLFEKVLSDSKNFIRISKSAIININFIDNYSKGEICLIKMKNASCFEVSRRKKGEVLDVIKNHPF